MGRKSTKQPGALVKLFRRNRPGLGIILETKKAYDIYAEARTVFKSDLAKCTGPYDLKFAKVLKMVAYSHYYTPAYVPMPREEHPDHNMFRAAAFFASPEQYSEKLKNRTMIKVRWFKRPSDWERTSIDKDVDWYPADSLRTVSAVKKSDS